MVDHLLPLWPAKSPRIQARTDYKEKTRRTYFSKHYREPEHLTGAIVVAWALTAWALTARALTGADVTVVATGSAASNCLSSDEDYLLKTMRMHCMQI